MRSYLSVSLALILLLIAVAASNAVRAATLNAPSIGDNLMLNNGTGDPPYVDKNFGGYHLIQVGGASRTIIRFDVSSIANLPGLQVNSINLLLTQNSIGGAGTVLPEVHQIDSDNAAWQEGTGNAAGDGEKQTGMSSQNWLSTPGPSDVPPGTAWLGGAGIGTGGYDATVLASATIADGSVADGTVNNFSFAGSTLTLTQMIQDWGTANAGLLIFSASGPTLRWYSKEAASAGIRPTLVIDYTIAEVPEPSSLTLGLMALVGLLTTSRHRRLNA